MPPVVGGSAELRLEAPVVVNLPARRVRAASGRLLHVAVLVVVALGLGSAPARAQEEAATLLQFMSAALRGRDYQGSFIYEHNGQIDALRLFHEGGPYERERLVSLSGTRSEVSREGDLITCLQAGMPTLLFPNRSGARLLPLVPDASGRAFAKLYALGLGGEDRVAGYRARIVDLVPRDAYRYGYRLWLEADSKLLLRSAVIDSNRRVLEQFMFVALDIGTKPKAGDLAPSAAAGLGAAPEEVPLRSAPRWRVTDPPTGFAYVGAHRTAQAPTQVEHYTYSDGVANVSVYVEPRDPKEPAGPDSASTRGVLNIYSHSEEDRRVVVVGDVPRATVQRMARSTQAAAPTRKSP